MKKIIIILLAFSIMPMILACGKNNDSDGVNMVATITEINDRYILVESEDENAVGEYRVNIDNSITKYYDAKNNKIAKKDLNVGDKIEITFAGQVTMSLPPQIFGQKIKLK